MNYRGLGMLGYGLQGLAFVAVGIASTLRIPRSFPVFGFDFVGLALAVPGLVVSLAWYHLWRVNRSGLYMVTSIFGCLVFVLSLTGSLWEGYSSSLANSSVAPFQIGAIFGAVALASSAEVFALVFFVLETISFFSAGSYLHSRMLRLAGWGRLFAVIASVVIFIFAIVFGLLSLLSSGAPGVTTLATIPISSTPASDFSRTLDLAVAWVYVVLAVPETLAFFGFRGLRSTTGTPPGASP